jgi:hypothetical protein
MNNPFAFPQCAYNLKGGYDIIGGMTLRDYFAAKAMQGMLSENSGIRYPTDELVEFAYKVADAMLKARGE